MVQQENRFSFAFQSSNVFSMHNQSATNKSVLLHNSNFIICISNFVLLRSSGSSFTLSFNISFCTENFSIVFTFSFFYYYSHHYYDYCYYYPALFIIWRKKISDSCTKCKFYSVSLLTLFCFCCLFGTPSFYFLFLYAGVRFSSPHIIFDYEKRNQYLC